MIINGKKIADKILKDLEIKRKKIKKPIKLGVILAGNHPVSLHYIKYKQKICKKLGVRFQLKQYPEQVSSNKLCQEIQIYQKQAKPTGLIIQLPLPRNLNTQRILNRVEYGRDVDCLSEKRMVKIFLNRNPEILPPTVAAILEIFKEYKINIKNQQITLIGYGTLVGRPLSAVLLNQGASLLVVQKSCKDLKAFTEKSDIVICATGQKNLLQKNMIKKGAIVLDAGASEDSSEKEKICGDVNFTAVQKKTRLITPVPGGIGPITLAMLMKNLFELMK